MSLNVKNFGVLAYSNGFTLWNYSTEDTITQMKAAGYFNEVAPFARAGDMIMATAIGASTSTSTILVISKIDNDVVTVAALS